MTVNEIMKAALALCGESSPAPYLSAFGVPWANTVLGETFETEQNIRRAGGKPELEKPPAVSSLSDEIVYSQSLVNPAFIFAFASFIAEVGSDRELAAVFRSRYVLAVGNAAKGFEHEIKDCYGGDGIV